MSVDDNWGEVLRKSAEEENPGDESETRLKVRLAAGLDKTAFGELTVAELTPEVQVKFAYSVNSRQVIAFPSGGSISHEDDKAIVSSGASANTRAFLLTRDVIRYESGQGAIARFTAGFTTGVANSEQVAGVGSPFDGFFFGYNGSDFGILHRARGKPEIRTLTLSSASTHDENITITLDGNAEAVPVTNSGDVSTTAIEIEAETGFAFNGTGWGVVNYGNVIEFVSIDAAAHSGAYSLTGTSAAGTFAQTQEGVAPTDTWINQASWNVDKMDGTGPSKMLLDTTKGNVFQIRYQWLGFGAIKFYIEDDVDSGRFQLVHIINYANQTTLPSVHNPTFGLFIESINFANTTALSVFTSSLSGFIEGKNAELGTILSADNQLLFGVGTNERPILTVQNKQVFLGQLNRVRIRPIFITLSSALNSATAFTVFRTYINANPTSGTSFMDIDSSNSVVRYDKSALSFDASSAQLNSTFTLSAKQSIIFDLTTLNSQIGPGQTFMVTAQPSKSHSSNEVGATMTWRELF